MRKGRTILGITGFLVAMLFFVLTPSFFADYLTKDGEINHSVYLILILICRITILFMGVLLFGLAISNRAYSYLIRYLKSNWTNYLLLFGSILLAFILIETVLYFLSPDELSNFYLVVKGNKTSEITYQNLEYNMSVKLNSQGFRNYKEFNAKEDEDIYGILILGDSFAFGSGVEQNETFAYLLEQYLNKNSNTKFEVYNLGISGTHPATYLRVLKKYGKIYKPDLVIASFFIGNDIIKGNLWSNKLDFLSFPQIRRLVRQKLLGIDNLLNDPAFKNTNADPKYIEYSKNGFLAPYVLLRTYYYPNITQYYDMLFKAFTQNSYTKEILLKISLLSNDLGAEFILMIIPEPFQISSYGIEKQRAVGYILDKNLIKDTRIQEAILSFAYENNISALDMTNPLKSSKLPPYYEIDLHWNTVGHEIVAKELYNRIIGIAK